MHDAWVGGCRPCSQHLCCWTICRDDMLLQQAFLILPFHGNWVVHPRCLHATRRISNLCFPTCQVRPRTALGHMEGQTTRRAEELRNTRLRANCPDTAVSSCLPTSHQPQAFDNEAWAALFLSVLELYGMLIPFTPPNR